MSVRRHFTFAALAGLNLAAPAYATDAPVGQDCVRIEDDARRLACYDSAFGHAGASARAASPGAAADVGTAAAASAGATAAAAPVAARPAQPREDFGLNEQAKQARAVQRDEPKPLDSITATVKSVGSRPTGEKVFFMEDGQVWMEIETYTRTRLKAGDTVTIRKASLGSFMLVTPNRVATHVRRMK